MSPIPSPAATVGRGAIHCQCTYGVVARIVIPRGHRHLYVLPRQLGAPKHIHLTTAVHVLLSLHRSSTRAGRLSGRASHSRFTHDTDSFALYIWRLCDTALSAT